MSHPALPADASPATAITTSPPPMPSIAASALLESRLLLDSARRAVASWLTRG